MSSLGLPFSTLNSHNLNRIPDAHIPVANCKHDNRSSSTTLLTVVRTGHLEWIIQLKMAGSTFLGQLAAWFQSESPSRLTETSLVLFGSAFRAKYRAWPMWHQKRKPGDKLRKHTLVFAANTHTLGLHTATHNRDGARPSSSRHTFRLLPDPFYRTTENQIIPLPTNMRSHEAERAETFTCLGNIFP